MKVITDMVQVCPQSFLGWGRGLHWRLLHPQCFVEYLDNVCSHGHPDILHHRPPAHTDDVMGRYWGSVAL